MYTKEETLKAKSIAILLLIFHHMYFNADSVAVNIDNKFIDIHKLSSIAQDARFCVWIFVFLSAYGMTFTYYRWSGNTNRFFWHRLVSLQSFCLPILIVYYCLAIIYKNGGAVFEKPYYILFNVLGLSDMFGMPALGVGYWYINFTILLILFLPLFILLCEKCGYTIIPITIVMFNYINPGIHSNSGGLYTAYLIAVLMGIIFYQKKLWEKLILVSTKNKILLIVPLCVLIVLLPHFRNGFVDDIWSIKKLLSTIPAIMVCIFSFWYCKNRYLEKVMSFLGKHSANMYLIHPFILSYLAKLVYASKNIVLSYVSCVVLTLIGSIILEEIKNICKYNNWIKRIHVFIDKKYSLDKM